MPSTRGHLKGGNLIVTEAGKGKKRGFQDEILCYGPEREGEKGEAFPARARPAQTVARSAGGGKGERSCLQVPSPPGGGPNTLDRHEHERGRRKGDNLAENSASRWTLQPSIVSPGPRKGEWREPTEGGTCFSPPPKSL